MRQHTMKLFEVTFPVPIDDMAILVLSEDETSALDRVVPVIRDRVEGWFDEADLNRRLAQIDIECLSDDVSIPGVITHDEN